MMTDLRGASNAKARRELGCRRPPHPTWREGFATAPDGSVAKEGARTRRTKGAGMAATRIRWDRLGRWALIAVFAFVLYLYIGPAVNWVATYRKAGEARQRSPC